MERQGFVVLPGNKEPASVKLKGRNMQALRGETLQLAVDNSEIQEQLEKLRREGQRLQEEKRQAGGFHWKTGQTGALSLPSNAVPRQGSKVGSGSGKVRIRVLREQMEEVKKTTPVSSLQTKWVTEAKRAKKCGQCENKPALLVCVECGEDFCVPCFSRMHHKGALRSHRSHPIQHSESATLTMTPDFVQRFKQDVGAVPDGRAARERGFHRISHATPPSNAGAKDAGVAFPSPSPPSTDARERNKLEGRASGLGEHGSEGAARGRRRIGPVDAAAAQGARRGGQTQGASETRRAAGPDDVPSRREDWGTGDTTASLLEGNFSEEESSRGFREAVAAWRGAAGPGATGPVEATRTSVSVSVEAREEIPVPSKALLSLNFPENPALSYMDRLLLKKHQRTPIEGLGAEAADWRIPERQSVQYVQGDENAAFSVAASENLEERKYYVEIFAVPQASAREPRPESSLTITEMAEGENSLEETEGFVLEEDGSPVNVSCSDEAEPGHSGPRSPLLDGDGAVSARTPRQQAANPVTPSPPRGGLGASETGLTTEPSEDLKNVGSRVRSDLPDYRGLQGFFSIGVGAGGGRGDSRRDATNLTGARTSRGAVSARGANGDGARTPSASGAPLSLLSGRHGDSRWRADSSLGVCADADLTKALLEEARPRRHASAAAHRPQSPAARTAARTPPAASAANARPSSCPSLSSRTPSSPIRPARSGNPGRGVRMSGALDVESNRDSDEDEERIVGGLERELALAVGKLHRDSPGEPS